jgi:hypothetical protein
MVILRYYFPSALLALVNHSLHLPAISTWSFPISSYLLAYLKKNPINSRLINSDRMAEILQPLILLISLWLYSPSDPARFFSFLILYTVRRTPWTGDQPFVRPLPTERTTQTQNKSTHTCMPRVAFEPTTAAFGRAKTVHALDRATTVIGVNFTYCSQMISQKPAL